MKLEEININDIKIETAGLILRPFEETDLDDFYEYAKVPGVCEAAGWKHHESKEESEGVLRSLIEGHRTFAIEEKESGKVIGSIGLGASPDIYKDSGIGENINDIGYLLAREYWGKGYSAEAVEGVLSYAFYVLHLDAVTCGHFAGNENSRSVIEKCGFKFITQNKYTTQQGTEYDALYYALTHLEYGVDYEYEDDKPAKEEEAAKEQEPAMEEEAAPADGTQETKPEEQAE